MHAAERFEGILEKVRECSDGLDKCKDQVKDIATRYDEVKNQRLSLFQVTFSVIQKYMKSN